MHRENIKIFSYGDSQGEVLDYIFHNDSRYVTFEQDKRVGWRSGLSIRGIKKYIENIIYPILEVESKVNKIIVFLCFGSTDIDWNLSYKRDIKKVFPDVNNYIKEMTYGIEYLLDNIRKLEELHKNKKIECVILFPYIPIDLRTDYLKNYNKKNNISGYYSTIATCERRELWQKYKESIINLVNNRSFDKNRCHIIDIGPKMLININNYDREYEDHHPDFIKTQHLISREIKNCNIGLDPICTLEKLYPHERRLL